jgi:hypothetical protein
MADGLGFDDMDEFGRELNDPLAELEQDVVHMLLEAFGSNPDVPTRGGGLVAALSGSAARIPAIRTHIESALQDDLRVASATVDIQATDTAGKYSVAIGITTSADALDLAFTVDSLGNIRRIT